MPTTKQSFAAELCEAVRNGASESDVQAMLDSRSAPEPREKRSFERVPINSANMPTLADYDAALMEIERLRGLSGEPGAEERAFAWGWRLCANWAKRDDLISDIGSPAYLADMRSALTKSATEPRDEPLRGLSQKQADFLLNVLRTGSEGAIDRAQFHKAVDVFFDNMEATGLSETKGTEHA